MSGIRPIKMIVQEKFLYYKYNDKWKILWYSNDSKRKVGIQNVRKGNDDEYSYEF